MHMQSLIMFYVHVYSYDKIRKMDNLPKLMRLEQYMRYDSLMHWFMMWWLYDLLIIVYVWFQVYVYIVYVTIMKPSLQMKGFCHYWLTLLRRDWWHDPWNCSFKFVHLVGTIVLLWLVNGTLTTKMYIVCF